MNLSLSYLLLLVICYVIYFGDFFLKKTYTRLFFINLRAFMFKFFLSSVDSKLSQRIVFYMDAHVYYLGQLYAL